VLAFVLDRAQVGALARVLKRHRPRDGEARLWVAYPKGGSGGVADLTRDHGWEPLQALGLRPVAQVAVDAVWSALRFRPTSAVAREQPVVKTAEGRFHHRLRLGRGPRRAWLDGGRV